jgi:nicotinate-nucleotide adenylyltransferase
MRAGWPVARAGQVVGLLGGSFDPAHGGHVHLSKVALRRFGLDQLWWLVSPANPLKDAGPAPLDTRLAQARAKMAHPMVRVTDLETRLGTRYTAETIAALQERYRGVRFVWLMGADNLAQFHRWKDADEIMARVPVGVLARPETRLVARQSRTARIYRGARLSDAAAGLLADGPAPRWCFVNMPMRADSSTALRRAGAWADQEKQDGVQ